MISTWKLVEVLCKRMLNDVNATNPNPNHSPLYYTPPMNTILTVSDYYHYPLMNK